MRLTSDQVISALAGLPRPWGTAYQIMDALDPRPATLWRELTRSWRKLYVHLDRLEIEGRVVSWSAAPSLNGRRVRLYALPGGVRLG